MLPHPLPQWILHHFFLPFLTSSAKDSDNRKHPHPFVFPFHNKIILTIIHQMFHTLSSTFYVPQIYAFSFESTKKKPPIVPLYKYFIFSTLQQNNIPLHSQNCLYNCRNIVSNSPTISTNSSSLKSCLMFTKLQIAFFRRFNKFRSFK